MSQAGMPAPDSEAVPKQPSSNAESLKVAVSSASDHGPKSTFRNLVGNIGYRYALVFVWVVMVVVFSLLRPTTFASVANFETIFASQSVLTVVTLALLLPLAVGEFDLSVGANLGFAAVLIAVLNVHLHWPIWLAVLTAVAAGAVIGALNAYFVVVVGVGALVCTLGVATLVTGVGFAVSNYLIISGISASLVDAVTYRVADVLPLSFFYAMLLAALMWYVSRYTPLGRHMIFVGANREVARLSGLPVQRLRIVAFVGCGILSALAGVVLAGTLGGEDPNAGSGYLLPAFSAAFLGATAVSPGQFNPWGAVIAVYFLVTGITGLQLLGLSDWIQDVFYGATLVVAITLQHLVAKRRAAGGFV